MNDANNRIGKLDALNKRAAEMKDALKEMQARRRAQERVDRQRLEALVGAVLLADAEAEDEEVRAARRAYISDALNRRVTGEGNRAFLKTKCWLAP
jgi:hypothetical protein